MNSDGVTEYTGYLLRRAQQAHVAAWQQEVSADFTSVQFGVMNVLAANPGASQRELCQHLDLDRSTIADIVARLERRGIVERIRDVGDKRRNVVQLTHDGELEFQRLVPKVVRVDRVLTGGLSADDAAALRRILNAMLSAPGVK
ncbi:MAG: transcriptional regulator, MarR family [Subtercola sp.]|jgi:DNA-binding MarR family transcriptional regulator|nr:transcriptional regulator, MarR family [Subtercola sp.]